MPNQSTPEIDYLRRAAWGPFKHPQGSRDELVEMVMVEDAIQAVRDTQDRTVREIVEALRERVAEDAFTRSADPWYDAADFIERTFLNGEGTT